MDRALAGTDKRRDARRKVLIPARMKQGVGWSDICIRDLSARGLLVQASAPPVRGTYVEIRRGVHIIVAKVAWSKGPYFGLTSQDRLPVDALILQPQSAASAGAAQDNAKVDRRATPRRSTTAQALARSRQSSSLIQYGFILILVVFFAFTLVGIVRDALSGGLGRAEAALAGRASPEKAD